MKGSKEKMSTRGGYLNRTAKMIRRGVVGVILHTPEESSRRWVRTVAV
jgi:hypothetical protein